MAAVKFYDRHNHCVAVIRFSMPGAGGHQAVAGIGDSRADALARASAIASRIMEDPVMSALIPPQARTAIVAAKGLAAAAKRGVPTLRHFWRRIKGPGKKRLARALLEEAKKQEVSDVGWNPLKAVKRAARRVVGKKKKRPPARRPPPMQRPMPEEEPEPQYDESQYEEQYDESQYEDGDQ
jgi:hypothetical protein